MSTLKGKTLFITGASRGIGLAIALRAARDGANVAVAAKTADPHPKLPGTVYSACEEIEKAGGKALPCITDIRFEDQVADAVKRTVEKFGGIDILVNNASAISLTPTPATPMKRFDLMHGINLRGTYAVTQACYPFLKKAANPHVLTLSPPLNFQPHWFGPHVAYSIAKYGMSLCTLGHAEEFKGDGIAVNSLWPRTVIATAAVKNLLGGDESMSKARTPEIMADAAYVILTKPSREFTGNFCIDDETLRAAGVKDLGKYACVPGTPDSGLLPDFFV
jgi:citronellol/citronellal dehydrogenase